MAARGVNYNDSALRTTLIADMQEWFDGCDLSFLPNEDAALEDFKLTFGGQPISPAILREAIHLQYEYISAVQATINYLWTRLVRLTSGQITLDETLVESDAAGTPFYQWTLEQLPMDDRAYLSTIADEKKLRIRFVTLAVGLRVRMLMRDNLNRKWAERRTGLVFARAQAAQQAGGAGAIVVSARAQAAQQAAQQAQQQSGGVGGPSGAQGGSQNNDASEGGDAQGVQRSRSERKTGRGKKVLSFFGPKRS